MCALPAVSRDRRFDVKRGKAGPFKIREIDDYMGPHITGNSEASGFITPDGVREIRARIAAGDPALLEQFGDEQTPEWKSLRLVIDYAALRGRGLIEANSVAGCSRPSHGRSRRTSRRIPRPPKRTIRGPSLEWLVLLGIMLIVVMLAPGYSTADSLFALILFASLIRR